MFKKIVLVSKKQVVKNSNQHVKYVWFIHFSSHKTTQVICNTYLKLKNWLNLSDTFKLY